MLQYDYVVSMEYVYICIYTVLGVTVRTILLGNNSSSSSGSCDYQDLTEEKASEGGKEVQKHAISTFK